MYAKQDSEMAQICPGKFLTDVGVFTDWHRFAPADSENGKTVNGIAKRRLSTLVGRAG